MASPFESGGGAVAIKGNTNDVASLATAMENLSERVPSNSLSNEKAKQLAEVRILVILIISMC